MTEILEETSDIKKIEREIGQYVYRKFKEQDDRTPDGDDEEESVELVLDSVLEEYCQRIDAAYDEIAILEAKSEAAGREGDSGGKGA